MATIVEARNTLCDAWLRAPWLIWQSPRKAVLNHRNTDFGIPSVNRSELDYWLLPRSADARTIIAFVSRPQ
jgi:hypothetical protein